MQTLIFSSQQPSKAKGFSLMELLIYLALAAVFIGGILTLTGKAGEDAEVRQAVQDISDIDNAIRSYYGAQRIPATTPPLPAQMEGVAAASLDRMQHPTATNTVISQFGTAIDIEAVNSTIAGYSWPNYWITYTGMRAETCAGILGSLSGPIAVKVAAGIVAAPGGWALADPDDRALALADAVGVENFCTDTRTIVGETYTVHALYRI